MPVEVPFYEAVSLQDDGIGIWPRPRRDMPPPPLEYEVDEVGEVDDEGLADDEASE